MLDTVMMPLITLHWSELVDIIYQFPVKLNISSVSNHVIVL